MAVSSELLLSSAVVNVYTDLLHNLAFSAFVALVSIQGGPKIGTTLYALTLPNINRL